MKMEYYDGATYQPIDLLAENVFFGDLDGYDGSSKTVKFKISNESGDPAKNNVMLRVIEKVSGNEIPFATVDNENKVVSTGGSPQIEGKVFYSVQKNADATPLDVTPDSNGLFNIGNLAVDGSLIYNITVDVSSRVLYDLGTSIKVSEIFFRYFSTTA